MKTIIIAPLLASALIFSPAANADKHRSKGGHSFSDTARVISVKPIYVTEHISEPREECSYEEKVYYDSHDRAKSHRVGHRDSAMGMIIGGVVGGAVGNELGHGSTSSRIAGAVIGSAIGHDIAGQNHASRRDHRRSEPRYRDERRCRTVTERRRVERIDGYNVKYRYHGHTFNRRMDRDPGKRVRVRVNVTPGIH